MYSLRSRLVESGRGSIPQEFKVAIANDAKRYLERGRPFDLPHTGVVEDYTQWLVEDYNRLKVFGRLDPLVMQTVASWHDTGYSELFQGDDGAKLDDVMDKKQLHMIKGAEYVRSFLEVGVGRGYFSDKQIDRIVHLVRVHDNIEQLRDDDEIVFMEADTLGAIDVDRVTPTFNKEDAMKYLERDVINRREPRFKSGLGKYYLEQNIRKFRNYFE